MDFKIVLIFVLCLAFPEKSFQQSRTTKNNSKYNEGIPYHKEASNWKTILIIAVSVLVFGAIIYGTSCFYVCKMHFFERTEKKYTKMDSATHV